MSQKNRVVFQKKLLACAIASVLASTVMGENNSPPPEAGPPAGSSVGDSGSEPVDPPVASRSLPKTDGSEICTENVCRVEGKGWTSVSRYGVTQVTVLQDGEVTKLVTTADPDPIPRPIPEEELQLRYDPSNPVGTLHIGNKGTLGKDTEKGVVNFTRKNTPRVEVENRGTISAEVRGRVGRDDSFTIKDESIVGNIKNFKTIVVDGNAWGGKEGSEREVKLTDPSIVKISSQGKLDSILSETKRLLGNNSFEITFNQAGGVFTIENRGTTGKVCFGNGGDEVDLNCSVEKVERPKLSFLQEEDGTTKTVVGSSGEGDEVTLAGGEITNDIINIDTIKAVGRSGGWTASGQVFGAKLIKAESLADPADDEGTGYVIDEVKLEASGSGGERTLSVVTNAPGAVTGKPALKIDGGDGLIKKVSIGNDSHFGATSGVDTISVVGGEWHAYVVGGETGEWHAYDVVTNPKTVRVMFGGYADKIAVNSGVPSVCQTLHLSFPPDTLNGDFEIVNHSGRIKTVDFQNPNRPDLRYVQHGGNIDVKLTGSLAKNDVLVNEYMSIHLLPQGFSGLAYDGGDLPPDYVFPEDLKHLEIHAGLTGDDTIKARTEPAKPQQSDTYYVPFSGILPASFYLKMASDVGKVDFSKDLKRPASFTYELASGTTNTLLGDASKDDKLILSGGNLSQDITNTFKTLEVTAPSDSIWSASGVFKGLDDIYVSNKGVVNTLSVFGQVPENRSVISQLTIATGASPVSLTVEKDATLEKLFINNGARLGSVSLNKQSTVILDASDNSWQAGVISNAGAFSALSDLNRLQVAGKDIRPAPLKSLSFVTLDHPLKFSVANNATIETFSLESRGRIYSDGSYSGKINNFSVSGEDWKACGWIGGVSNFTTASVVDHVYVSDAYTVLPESYEIAARLRFATGKPADNRALSVSTTDNGKIGNLEIHQQAHIASITGAEKVQIKSNDNWRMNSWLTDAKSIAVYGTADEIIASDTMHEDIKDRRMYLRFNGDYADGDFFELHSMTGGTVNQADFSADVNRPALKYVQDGGISREVRGLASKGDILELKQGRVEDSSGFLNYQVTGDDWSGINLTDPIVIDIGEQGVADRIEDIPRILLSDIPVDGHIQVSFSEGTPVPVEVRARAKAAYPGTERLPGFVVANTGGFIDTINFSQSDRPELVVYHSGGTTANIHGGPGQSDQLRLSGGQVGAIDGMESIWLTGKDWTAGIATNPAIVNVSEDGVVSQLTTVPPAHKPGRLVLDYTHNMVPLKGRVNGTGEVTVISSGKVGTINFNDSLEQRPSMKIVQNGGIIGTITGRVGYGDSIDVTGSTITGNVTGLDSLTFSGMDTIFRGTEIQTIGPVNVTGKLRLASGSVSIEPVKDYVPPEGQKVATRVHVAEGATLAVLDRQPGGTLDVTGIYQQDGALDVPLTADTDKDVAFVKATSVQLGEKASITLHNEREAGEGEVYNLMEAATEAINRTPAVKELNPNRYTSYYTRLDPTQEVQTRLQLATMPKGDHIGGLAKSGGAGESAQMAIKVATDRKETSSLLASVDDKDPLNTWTLRQSKAVDDDPARVAEIARQMTPDNTGASIASAKAGLQQAGNAIGVRQSGRRTGISAGDLYMAGGIWLQYAYSDATQEERDSIYGYEAETHGFTFGGDTDVNEEFNLGVAYTYSDGKVKGKDGSTNKADTEAHIFSVYSTMTNGPAFLDAHLSYSMGENNATRFIQENGGGINEVKAAYDASSWNVSLTAGYNLPLGDSRDWSWQPLLVFNYSSIETDDYEEESVTGDSADTLRFDKVQNNTYDVMEAGAGIKIIGDIDTGNMMLKPEFSLMGYHDFKDDPVTMTAQYAAGGNAFLVHGAKREEDRFRFTAGGDMEFRNNLTLTFSYSYDWMDKFAAHGFIARLRYNF